VLAGLIAGAAARCKDPLQAACWGTYLQLAAGKHLTETVGPIGFLAREIAGSVPIILASFDGSAA
jgi:ADP-dependent NAD(P)H-hydrate dehydratase